MSWTLCFVQMHMCRFICCVVNFELLVHLCIIKLSYQIKIVNVVNAHYLGQTHELSLSAFKSALSTHTSSMLPLSSSKC